MEKRHLLFCLYGLRQGENLSCFIYFLVCFLLGFAIRDLKHVFLFVHISVLYVKYFNVMKIYTFTLSLRMFTNVQITYSAETKTR